MGAITSTWAQCLPGHGERRGFTVLMLTEWFRYKQVIGCCKHRLEPHEWLQVLWQGTNST